MDKQNDYSNIPDFIKQKIGKNVHNMKGHPIKIIKDYIYDYFNGLKEYNFKTFDDLPPFVSIEQNFDLLLIPETHPSRSKSDTYYINETTVLRTQTSAHQNELLELGYKSFLVTGDVYRKDEIDNRHYPVFTQMEGVHIVSDDKDPVDELKKILSGLIMYLFPDREYRFNNDYFPFTEPSFEIEVKFGDRWLEVLGCGIMHHKILDRLNIKQKAIAFGLGLDRFAMILFDIPDIRLLWTNDSRFLEQFKSEKIIKFIPYPKIKPIPKDISFWIEDSEITGDKHDFKWTKINDFYEYVREICGNSIESVELLDNFFHPKKNKYSVTFRLYVGTDDLDEDKHAEVTSYANNCLNKVIKKTKDLKYEIR